MDVLLFNATNPVVISAAGATGGCHGPTTELSRAIKLQIVE
jgi:hypothetical protein